ncbi:MAG: sulfatase-like hydrolase/transferase, partial [Acidobacteriota bacterium]
MSIDTLRADRLGFHGYDKHTSPFLDRLAERSTVFERAIVQVPGTLPSHMSIFTGLYPKEHGVYPPDG